MYLILSTPSIDYADEISRELWRLVQPASVAHVDDSQYYCGTWSHGAQVCIGPLNGPQPIHADADETRLPALIGPAVTDAEELLIEVSIEEAKGGSLSILAMVESIDSLSPNLRTREQLEAAGWFASEEV